LKCRHTTPPDRPRHPKSSLAHETVTWFLLNDPIQVAESDIAAFAKLYPLNARPVQSVNRRFILRSG
jgi:carbonic anhydrase